VTTERPKRAGLRGAPLLAGLIVFFSLLALYTRTLLPDVGFWDTAEFQTLGAVLGIAHPTGYPSYTLLAWLASVVLQPFGEAALRANLLSAILAAGGAGLVAASVTMLSRRAVLGIAAGVVLGVSHVTWAVGLRADAHALHLTMVALLLLLLLAWQQRERAGERGDRLLLAAAVVFGVSLGNHALTLLLAPGIALFVLATFPRLLVDRPRLVLGCVGALVLTTALLYAYLPLRSAMDPPLDYANPQTWEGFRYLVFAEQFRGSFRGFPGVADALATVAGETLEQLGLFAVLAILGLVVSLFRWPQLLLMLAAWFVVNWGFALGYVNADIERYRLAPMLSVAVLGGLGAGALLEAVLVRWRRWAPGDRVPARRAVANAGRIVGSLLLGAMLLAAPLVAVPERFRQVDQSEWAFAREWLQTVLPQLEENALVISWWGFSTTLWYAQFVEGQRPDIFVADDRTILDLGLGGAIQVIDENLGRRPVYLIRLSHDLPAYEERYRMSRITMPGWSADGWVQRVEGLRAGP